MRQRVLFYLICSAAAAKCTIPVMKLNLFSCAGCRTSVRVEWACAQVQYLAGKHTCDTLSWQIIDDLFVIDCDERSIVVPVYNKQKTKQYPFVIDSRYHRRSSFLSWCHRRSDLQATDAAVSSLYQYAYPIHSFACGVVFRCRMNIGDTARTRSTCRL